MNAHDAIVAAIVAALLAGPALAGGRVSEEADFDQLPQGVDQAVSVAMLNSEPRAILLGASAPIDWRTTVRVLCFARVDTAGAAGRASRALHAAVYARLMADQSLGGLVSQIEPPTLASNTELIGTRMGVLSADYVIHHRSSSTSLEI